MTQAKRCLIIAIEACFHTIRETKGPYTMQARHTWPWNVTYSMSHNQMLLPTRVCRPRIEIHTGIADQRLARQRHVTSVLPQCGVWWSQPFCTTCEQTLCLQCRECYELVAQSTTHDAPEKSARAMDRDSCRSMAQDMQGLQNVSLADLLHDLSKRAVNILPTSE